MMEISIETIVAAWVLAGLAGFLGIGFVTEMFDGQPLLWGDAIAFVALVTLGPVTFCAAIVFGLMILLDCIVSNDVKNAPVFGRNRGNHGY